MNNEFYIIPAIDLIEGKCVRLTQGDYSQKKVYNENPVEIAKSFQDAGIKRLHLVDLDGAKAKHIVNWRVLENIARATDLIIDFGGGVRTDNDIEIAFSSGANQVTGGSIAVKEPELFEGWLEKYGSEKKSFWEQMPKQGKSPSIVTGKVATLELVENAMSCAGLIPFMKYT